MDEITVPIYLITGFLESGKTSFLSFTLQQDYFRTEGKTLLILCEEGEEEYDEEALAKDNVVVEVIEKEEDFTPERLQALDIIHQPERVVMEYNGMWLVSKFEEMKLPAGWGIEQHITCVDASTFQVYMQNMKSIFMDMVRNADMVVFNRSKKEYPLANFRRSIKVVNPSAEVIFEDEEGEMTDIFADQMPFDLDAEIVDIPPEDYGIWFVDAMDHPDRYVGKTLRFKARARRPRGMGSKFFIPGRADYMREELVAELSAALCGALLGFATTPREENAAYLKGWLEELNREPTYLFDILTDVNRAVRMISERLTGEDEPDAIPAEAA